MSDVNHIDPRVELSEARELLTVIQKNVAVDTSVMSFRVRLSPEILKHRIIAYFDRWPHHEDPAE